MCFDDKIRSYWTTLDLLKSGKTIPEISSITGIKKASLIKQLKSDLLEKIKLNLDNGSKPKEIARKLGLGYTTVLDWIKDNNLSSSSKNNREKGLGSLAKRVELLKEFAQGKGITAVSKKFHVHRQTAKKLLTEQGFKIFNGNTVKKLNEALRGESFVKFSEYIKEVITGSLLGDGFIEPKLNRNKLLPQTISSFKDLETGLRNIDNMKNLPKDFKWKSIAHYYNNALKAMENHPTAIFGLNKSTVETPWLREIRNIFKKNNLNPYFSKGFNKTFNKHSLLLRHKSTHQMFEEWKRWYVDGKKILPTDLKITPTVIRHWFAGDGRLTKDNCVIFCSESFTERENKELLDNINKEIGIQAIVSPHRKSEYPNRKYWRISVNKQVDVRKIFNYIERGNDNALNALKQTMPWKFDPKLRKMDVITDAVYKERVGEATKLAAEK